MTEAAAATTTATTVATTAATEEGSRSRSDTPISTYGEKPKIVKLEADGEEYYIGSEVGF